MQWNFVRHIPVKGIPGADNVCMYCGLACFHRIWQPILYIGGHWQAKKGFLLKVQISSEGENSEFKLTVYDKIGVRYNITY